MSSMLLKPMGIGQLIDRSFQLYRKHFVKLVLIMLILFGPIYLLQSLLLTNEQPTGSTSIFEQLQEDASFEEMMLAISENTNTMDIWQVVLFFLVVLPVLLLIVAPVAVSSIVFMVRAFLSGDTIPEVGELLRRSFSRLGPLAGSTVLVGLIWFGIYIVTAIALTLMIIAGALIAGVMNGFEGAGPGAGLIIFMVLGGIILFFGFALLLSFFVIRFGYYLPFVALGEESIGIGRSWRITRKSFWRLFLMYLVLSIVIYIFIIVITLLLAFVMGDGLVPQLLQSLVTIVLMPLWIIPYTLSFFDLKARNEGTGLEALIQSTIQDNEPITAHE